MAMRLCWYARNSARVRVHCLTTGTPAANGKTVRGEECLAAGAIRTTMLIDEASLAQLVGDDQQG